MNVKPLYDESLLKGLYLKVNKYFRDRTDKKKPQKSKCQSLGGGYLFSYGIKKMGFVADEIRIDVTEKGKPFVSNENIFFNIAHSDEMAVCAFGTSEIGVDIEKIKPLSEKLLSRISLPSERAKISAAKQIVKLWTRKEALAKCLGTGVGESVYKTDLSEDVISLDGTVYRLKSFEVGEYMISVCTEFDFPPEEIVKVKI